MARGKKAKAPQPQSNVSKDTFLEFLGDVANAKQKIADAQMANGRMWKKTDSLGIHSDAAKLIQKLSGMSEEKRADFLRAFDKYRSYMPWEAQLDLLEHATNDADGQAGEFDAEDEGATVDDQRHQDEDERERGPAELNFEERTDRGDADPMLEETVQEWETAVDLEQDTEALDTAGNIFGEGKEAGLRGEGPEASPHEAGSRGAEIWERGRAVGARELAAAQQNASHDAAESDEGHGNVAFFDEGDDEGMGADVAIADAALAGTGAAAPHVAAE